jgi:hypothetical protein
MDTDHILATIDEMAVVFRNVRHIPHDTPLSRTYIGTFGDGGVHTLDAFFGLDVGVLSIF